MTPTFRSGPRASPEGAKTSAGGRAGARVDAAPALFRLLSDSALYRAAFVGCRVPLAIVEASASGAVLVGVNPAFERRFGLSEAEVRSRSLAMVLCRGDREAESALFTGPIERVRLKLWCKDGTPTEMDVSVGAVRDASGRQTHWILSFDGCAEPVLP
jgi:PAS domain S-box-containing protein